MKLNCIIKIIRENEDDDLERSKVDLKHFCDEYAIDFDSEL
jgi:hypothetical protein